MAKEGQRWCGRRLWQKATRHNCSRAREKGKIGADGSRGGSKGGRRDNQIQERRSTITVEGWRWQRQAEEEGGVEDADAVAEGSAMASEATVVTVAGNKVVMEDKIGTREEEERKGAGDMARKAMRAEAT
ncbi:hypothetical protein B296_00030096 [Ensete ventricosum]|uniref:Uncharacterized protein n=1 Tax=Ensete ventricosum TaxID=4639 RepID=A0A426XSV1_ENSVE|nr:hypothetical protein B296_00030096 [Ensete ventricosum]